MKYSTKIGRSTIPVRGRNAKVIYFRAGAHGKKESGLFAFWTAVLKVGRYNPFSDRNCRMVTARALVGLAAGERFDRMRLEMKRGSREQRVIYRWLYSYAMKCGRNVKYIRPATSREVAMWLRGHSRDAKHAIYAHDPKPRLSIASRRAA